MPDRPAKRRHHPSVKRRALTLRHLRGMTVRAIAAEIGVPRSTVGGWIRRP